MRLLSFISLSGLCVTSPTPPSSPDPEATSNTHTSRPLANYSSISPKPINPTSPTSPRGYTPPTPLKVCHDPNLGGSCFLYRLSAGCAGNPFNVDAIKSYELETGFLCEFYPYLDCRHDRGPPIIVNSKNAWIRANEVTYQIWSVYCHRASYVGSRRRSGRPGDTTVCGGPNFGACRENENALDGCVSFSAGVESLMQFKGVVCKWYQVHGCLKGGGGGEGPFVVNSVDGTVKLPHLGKEKDGFQSVECRAEHW